MAKKLVHIITSKKNGNKLTKSLLGKGFHITVVDGLGGFTKKKFSVIMLGLEERKINSIVKLAKNCCQTHKERSVNNIPIPTLGQEDLVQSQPTKTVDIKVGGATILVSPLDEIHKV